MTDENDPDKDMFGAVRLIRENMTDDTKNELIETINKHLPPRDSHPINDQWAEFINNMPDDDRAELRRITFALASPTGPYDVWNLKDEEKKIDKLITSARELGSLWRTLPEGIRELVENKSEQLCLLNQKQFADAFPGAGDSRFASIGDVFDSLGGAPDMLDPSVERASLLELSFRVAWREIEQATPLGRRKWRAVGLVDACRDIWHRRTGDEAPKSLDPTSPFGEFVQDIFDVVSLDSDPRSAMNSWRKVHS